MTDELVIRRADNGWIVMRYVDGVVETSVHEDGADVLWDVVELMDIPQDGRGPDGVRSTLVCYYRREDE
jgi:hypothetical protein